MTDSNAPVALDGNGMPQGFLQHVEELSVIRVELRPDGILIITLNRPERLNAFDERMIREMRSVIWKANFDDRIRVIVITGTGAHSAPAGTSTASTTKTIFQLPGYRAYVRANHELFDDLEAIEAGHCRSQRHLCGWRRGDGDRLRLRMARRARSSCYRKTNLASSLRPARAHA